MATALTRNAAKTTAVPIAIAAVPAKAEVKSAFTKADRRELKQLVKRAKVNSLKADEKSRIVAAVLCFFLGLLGVHRFCLGYTGIGILMLLTFGLFSILTLIDFIRILIGDLKPKGGDYATKL